MNKIGSQQLPKQMIADATYVEIEENDYENTDHMSEEVNARDSDMVMRQSSNPLIYEARGMSGMRLYYGSSEQFQKNANMMIGEPWNPLQHDVSKATDSLFEREDLFKMN